MTHTLHRHGSIESLRKDYCVLALVARQFDLKTEESKASALERLKKIADVVARHGPTNFGSLYVPGTYAHGLTDEQIKEGLKPNGFVLCVFSDRDGLRDTLAELKEKDFGISITVSGLVREVFDTCEEVGLQPHTVSFSLGVWGKKKLLPRAEVLEITTMCGHAMTSTSLVNRAIEDVRAGRTTAEAAARELAQPCACGCFNTTRAAELLQKAAEV